MTEKGLAKFSTFLCIILDLLLAKHITSYLMKQFHKTFLNKCNWFSNDYSQQLGTLDKLDRLFLPRIDVYMHAGSLLTVVLMKRVALYKNLFLLLIVPPRT